MYQINKADCPTDLLDEIRQRCRFDYKDAEIYKTEVGYYVCVPDTDINLFVATAYPNTRTMIYYNSMATGNEDVMLVILPCVPSSATIYFVGATPSWLTGLQYPNQRCYSYQYLCDLIKYYASVVGAVTTNIDYVKVISNMASEAVHTEQEYGCAADVLCQLKKFNVYPFNCMKVNWLN